LLPRPRRPARERMPKRPNAVEEALAIDDGGKAWLPKPRLADALEAVTSAELDGPAGVDQALGTAALAGRLGEDDVAANLTHQHGPPPRAGTRASGTHSLQPGTAGWVGLAPQEAGG
jgi:hypothetical protein